jgi:hypothetical protein
MPKPSCHFHPRLRAQFEVCASSIGERRSSDVADPAQGVAAPLEEQERHAALLLLVRGERPWSESAETAASPQFQHWRGRPIACRRTRAARPKRRPADAGRDARSRRSKLRWSSGHALDREASRTPGAESANQVCHLGQPEVRDGGSGQARLVALVADQGDTRVPVASSRSRYGQAGSRRRSRTLRGTWTELGITPSWRVGSQSGCR